MDEKIFTGYCRCLDQSRMVTVEAEDGQPSEIDCAYFHCIHRDRCVIAQQIADFLKINQHIPLYSR